ncbi:MAG: carboxypeptidase regulatory-like domain-containing protein [Planctomycetes bacterium]|nr:carboxypeptidase regulatory-like domain-containing protein [Planctomycetota bacterium]
MVRAAYVLIGVLVISSLLFLIYALDRDPAPLSPRTTHHPPPEPPAVEPPKPKPPPPEKRVDPPGAGRRKYDPSLCTASVSGVVKFKGEVPKARTMKTPPRVGLTEPIPDESLIVTRFSTLKNVVVTVSDESEALEGWEFPPAEGTLEMEIRGYRFAPHVMCAREGQTLRLTNHDPMHQEIEWHGWPNPGGHLFLNTGESTEIPLRGRRGRYSDAVQVHFESRSDSWMDAYVAVSIPPFFCVTGDDGCYDLHALPPGRYRVNVWHELFHEDSRDVEVADGENLRLDFEFEDRWGSWKYRTASDD